MSSTGVGIGTEMNRLMIPCLIQYLCCWNRYWTPSWITP